MEALYSLIIYWLIYLRLREICVWQDVWCWVEWSLAHLWLQHSYSLAWLWLVVGVLLCGSTFTLPVKTEQICGLGSDTYPVCVLWIHMICTIAAANKFLLVMLKKHQIISPFPPSTGLLNSWQLIELIISLVCVNAKYSSHTSCWNDAHIYKYALLF